jgi:deoxyxylulose-5-phosphate synthase
MQKFRDYIYIDRQRVDSFINQIPELKKSASLENYQRETIVEGGMNIKIAKAGTTLNEVKGTTYDIREDSLESLIDWSHKEKNAINYSDEILSIDNTDNLIILSGKMSMPETSEYLEVISSLQKHAALLDMVPIKEKDKQLLTYLKESNSIPILLENDSQYLFSSNLQRANFVGNVDDFMDNIGEDINILGRIDKIYNEESEVEIFNLAKEVFKLNRAAIRNLPKEDLKNAFITEKGPLVKITPIAIYK